MFYKDYLKISGSTFEKRCYHRNVITMSRKRYVNAIWSAFYLVISLLSVIRIKSLFTAPCSVFILYTGREFLKLSP